MQLLIVSHSCSPAQCRACQIVDSASAHCIRQQTHQHNVGVFVRDHILYFLYKMLIWLHACKQN